MKAGKGTINVQVRIMVTLDGERAGIGTRYTRSFNLIFNFFFLSGLVMAVCSFYIIFYVFLNVWKFYNFYSEVGEELKCEFIYIVGKMLIARKVSGPWSTTSSWA